MFATLRKCLALLPAPTRWRWFRLIPLAVVAAAMEAVGAAAVFAVIAIINDPSRAFEMPVISWIYRVLPWRDPQPIVLSATAAVVSFYLLKNAALAGLAMLQAGLTTDSITEMSRMMLRGYLTVPFSFHFRRNSAELIRNTMESVDHLFNLIVTAVVTFVSEALVVAAVVTVLLATAPSITLIAVAILFSLLALLIRFTRGVLSRWGKQEHALYAIALQTLQQSLGGLKEVKVRGREPFFYERFTAQQYALTRLRNRRLALATILRLLIETVFIGGTLLVVALLTLHGRSGHDIAPLLGLYAYAGFRVIPSINRMLFMVSNIRYGAASVEPLYADVLFFQRHPGPDPRRAPTDGISFADRLALDAVSYRYDGAPTLALDNVSVTINRGESLGVVGPTGAGKSTLIDILLGLLTPTSGRVTADGTDISAARSAWQCKIGYVPQAVYLTDDTLRRNIAFGLDDAEIDPRQVDAAVHMAQLDAFVAGLPLGLDTRVGERGLCLSGGERQRVAIARALYHEPELLVFDEATAALDAQTERELTAAIDALHGTKTLIIIAHRLSTVRRCDRLVLLQNGRLAGVGSFDDLAATNTAFRRLSLSPDAPATPPRP